MTRTNPPTERIRIWIWYSQGDCAVRITLQRGVPLLFLGGGPTDEGYGVFGESYHWDGLRVWREWFSRGRDCDGSHEDGAVSWWAPGMETVGEWIGNGNASTDWQEIRNESIQCPVWESCSERFCDQESLC